MEQELEANEQEELDRELLKVGPAVVLPEVPTAEPAGKARTAAKASKEADDMAELAAWAS